MSTFGSAPGFSHPGEASLIERETPPPERRMLSAFPVSGVCRVVVFDGIEARGARGTISEVARDAVRINSEIRALPGMKVEVLLPHAIILGEVKHCNPSSDGGFDLSVLVETTTGNRAWNRHVREHYTDGRQHGSEKKEVHQ